jgi:hypothetical protein
MARRPVRREHDTEAVDRIGHAVADIEVRPDGFDERGRLPLATRPMIGLVLELVAQVAEASQPIGLVHQAAPAASSGVDIVPQGSPDQVRCRAKRF